MIEFDVPNGLPTACWNVKLLLGGREAVHEATAKPFAQKPAPTLTAATKAGNRIEVEGTGFVDLKDCEAPLAFKIVEDTAGAAELGVTNLTLTSATEASCDLPSTPANATWVAKVFVGDVESDKRTVQ